MNTERNANKNALADNVQRTVERTALRKVRKLADELEAEEIAKHRLGMRALIIAVVAGTVFVVWFVLGMIESDKKFDREQTIQLPDKIVLPKKD